MRRPFGKGMKRALAGLAALCLFSPALTAPALAQVPDPFARDLARQLSVAESADAHRDFFRIAGPFAGGLAPHLNRRIQVTLRAGQQYEVIGVCDMRCGGLNLRVYDGADRLLAQGAPLGAMRVVHVRPVITNPHTIEVTLDSCGEAECFYAFNVYAR